MHSLNGPHGHVFWLFGLSGAGKSTLAEQLTQQLRERGVPVLAIDGDVLRAGLSRDLGFALADRTENIRRAAEIAKLGVRSGICVVASFITPLEQQRQLADQVIGADHLSLIHVSTPLPVCAARDVKGLYARAQAGEVPMMTGITSAFDPPVRVDWVLPTEGDTVAVSASRLLAFALRKIQLPAPSRP